MNIRKTGNGHIDTGPVIVPAVLIAMAIIVAGVVFSCTCNDDAEADTSGFTYVYESGDIIITGYTGSIPSELIIPSTINGEKVLAVGTEAFDNETTITKVVISDRVGVVRTDAFSGCTGITTLTVNGNIDVVQPGAFSGCTSIENEKDGVIYININGKAVANRPVSSLSGVMTIPDKVNSLTVSAVGSHAFQGQTEITGITLPNGVTEICNGAFNNCVGISGPLYLDNVLNIGDGAFNGCTGITSVKFANNVWIGDAAFNGCTGIANMESVGSPNHIGIAAFNGCYSVTEIRFNGTISSIGVSALSLGTATNLTSASVYGISHNCFSGYTNSHTTFTYYLDVEYSVPSGLTAPTPMYNKTHGFTFQVEDLDATYSGHDFIGWNHNGHVHYPGEILKIGSNSILLVAMWGDVKKTIHYDNTCTDTPDFNMDYEEGDLVTVAPCGCNKHPDKNFAGWQLKDTTTMYHPGDTFVMGDSDMTLVAVWVSESLHPITYDINGGTGHAPYHPSVASGTTLIVSTYDGTRGGYSFIGWEYNDILYVPGDVIVVTGPIVLHAVFDGPDLPPFIPLPPEDDFIPPIYVIEEDDDWIIVAIAGACIVVLMICAYLVHDMRRP